MAREKKKTGSARQAKDAGQRIAIFRKEHLILLVIFLFAVFVRIQADPSIPYHYDPGKNIVYARAALQSFPLFPQTNPYFNLGEYFEYQALFPYTVAFLSFFTGISLVEVTKWLVILAGAALCLTVYLLSLEVFHDETAALVSAFVIAASKIQLLAYMNYYPQILAMTLMPLGFLFLIRYVRNRNAGDLALAAILSSLIVIASYIAAFVYFLIALISLALWAVRDKRAAKTIILLPALTMTLMAFFLMPMAWRYGVIYFFGGARWMLFHATDSPFTNVPWTLLDYFSYSGITVVTILMGIVALWLVRKVEWDFGKLLLAVWLTLVFLLMESYLVRPVLWVDRYAQFLDIAVLLVTGTLFSLFISRLNADRSTKVPYGGYILLLILILPFYSAVHVDTIYGKWGYPSDYAAAEYMKGFAPGTLVAAPPSVQSFWFSALSGVRVLGGESAQILLFPGYRGDGDTGAIINSPDAEKKMELIRKYGVNYVVIPYHTPEYMMWNPDLNQAGVDAFNNTKYFAVEKFFEDRYGSTVIIRVKEELTPRYNTPETPLVPTAAGYLVSLAAFAGCLYLCSGKKLPEGFLRKLFE